LVLLQYRRQPGQRSQGVNTYQNDNGQSPRVQSEFLGQEFAAGEKQRRKEQSPDVMDVQEGSHAIPWRR
jgi:hypothetical protein